MAVTTRAAIEPMRLADVAAVHEIERLSFSSPWPAYAFEQELTGNRMARYVVARVGELVVGFAGLWLMLDEAHITTFGVHPAWRRRGIGQQLLHALVELSIEVGATRMTLEVRVSNTAAQALYADFGFAVAGRRTAYYTDDGEDALIMTTPELHGTAMQTLLEIARRHLAPRGPEPRDAEPRDAA